MTWSDDYCRLAVVVYLIITIIIWRLSTQHDHCHDWQAQTEDTDRISV